MSRDHATRGFLIHLGVYVLVVGLLAALNLYRNPDDLWFIWVLLCFAFRRSFPSGWDRA